MNDDGAHNGRYHDIDDYNGHVESQPHDGPITILSTVDSDETEEWTDNEQFCNVVGSSGDIPEKDDGGQYSSWLEAWSEVTENTGNIQCMVDGCGKPAEVGGHVVVPGVSFTESRNGRRCPSHSALRITQRGNWNGPIDGVGDCNGSSTQQLLLLE